LDRLDRCPIDRELVTLVRRCLAVEPSARPANAGVVAQALADHRNTLEVRLKKAELSATDTQARKEERSTIPWKIGAGMLVLAFLVYKLIDRGVFDQPAGQQSKPIADARKTVMVSALRSKLREADSKLGKLATDLPDDILLAIAENRITPEQAAVIYFLVKSEKADGPDSKQPTAKDQPRVPKD
jgi:hypothetical protein